MYEPQVKKKKYQQQTVKSIFTHFFFLLFSHDYEEFSHRFTSFACNLAIFDPPVSLTHSIFFYFMFEIGTNSKFQALKELLSLFFSLFFYFSILLQHKMTFINQKKKKKYSLIQTSENICGKVEIRSLPVDFIIHIQCELSFLCISVTSKFLHNKKYQNKK